MFILKVYQTVRSHRAEKNKQHCLLQVVKMENYLQISKYEIWSIEELHST